MPLAMGGVVQAGSEVEMDGVFSPPPEPPVPQKTASISQQKWPENTLKNERLVSHKKSLA